MKEGGTEFALIPRSVYRLQLNKEFTFSQARQLVKYLNWLGISHLYLSPIFRARKGSLHGYDVVDYGRINPELGTNRDFESLVRQLKRNKMGILLDMVPNHMSASDENTLWMSVLEYGRHSPHADFFDIYWAKKGNPPDKLFLPVLGEKWESIIAKGKVRICFDKDRGIPFMRIGEERRLPLTPESYPLIFDNVIDKIRLELSPEEEQLSELQRLVDSIKLKTPPSMRYRAGELLKRRLRNFFASSPELLRHVHGAFQELNVSIGENSKIIDLLAKLQFYSLGHFRDDATKVNYRRFFEVNDLAAIGAEVSRVFLQSHSLLLKLLVQGKADGVRIDHPDGLRDPGGYFRRLQRVYSRLKRESNPKAGSSGKLFVIAEKILVGEEKLNNRWEVGGTTGYDFASDATQLFVYPRVKEFDRIYQSFTRRKRNFTQASYLGKKEILRTLMQSELGRLSDLLYAISSKTKTYQHLTPHMISRVLEEVIARFPVYRTYVTERTNELSEDESMYVNHALDAARVADKKAHELLGHLLRLQELEGVSFRERRNFVLRFQQLTGPIMAKGVEDTAFYTYVRLSSLNEVGGNPGQFGISLDTFHSRNKMRAGRWPHSFLTSSTHDTKRSEDVRERINVLSEIPGEWKSSLFRWADLNSSKKSNLKGVPAPSRNDEYLIYQTLLGAWPLDFKREKYKEFETRIVSYARKAAKEAKENTSWLYPDEDYDAALENFVRKILERKPSNGFLKDLEKFGKKIQYFGMLNSLSSLLLKLTVPGVPDTYQGNETWDFSLVDPDNRRKVDYERINEMHETLREMLKEMAPAVSTHLLDTWKNGLIKMYSLHLVLKYRSFHAKLFESGGYLPIAAKGPLWNHICAFARRYNDEVCLVIAPRFFAKLMHKTNPPIGEIWKNTRIILPSDFLDAELCNLFTGECLSAHFDSAHAFLLARDIFASFPLALLMKKQDPVNIQKIHFSNSRTWAGSTSGSSLT